MYVEGIAESFTELWSIINPDPVPVPGSSSFTHPAITANAIKMGITLINLMTNNFELITDYFSEMSHNIFNATYSGFIVPGTQVNICIIIRGRAREQTQDQ